MIPDGEHEDTSFYTSYTYKFTIKNGVVVKAAAKSPVCTAFTPISTSDLPLSQYINGKYVNIYQRHVYDKDKRLYLPLTPPQTLRQLNKESQVPSYPEYAKFQHFYTEDAVELSRSYHMWFLCDHLRFS